MYIYLYICIYIGGGTHGGVEAGRGRGLPVGRERHAPHDFRMPREARLLRQPGLRHPPHLHPARIKLDGLIETKSTAESRRLIESKMAV